MCRNIRTLHNFAPPATEDAFNRAIDQVTLAARELLKSLVSNAPPRDRDIEAIKARARSAKRFATVPGPVVAGHSHG